MARLPRPVVMMSDGSHRGHTAAGPGPQTVVVTLPAEIDIANAGQVHAALTGALCAGAVVLAADATGTAFCDCAGVSALVRAHHQAAAAGAQLRVAASPAIRRILELTGTDHLLHTYPTLTVALDSEQHPAEQARAGGPWEIREMTHGRPSTKAIAAPGGE